MFYSLCARSVPSGLILIWLVLCRFPPSAQHFSSFFIAGFFCFCFFPLLVNQPAVAKGDDRNGSLRRKTNSVIIYSSSTVNITHKGKWKIKKIQHFVLHIPLEPRFTLKLNQSASGQRGLTRTTSGYESSLPLRWNAAEGKKLSRTTDLNPTTSFPPPKNALGLHHWQTGSATVCWDDWRDPSCPSLHCPPLACLPHFFFFLHGEKNEKQNNTFSPLLPVRLASARSPPETLDRRRPTETPSRNRAAISVWTGCYF